MNTDKPIDQAKIATDIDVLDREFADLVAVSVKQFCRMTSLGKTLNYCLIRNKELDVVRVRGRTLITMRSVRGLMAADGKLKARS